MKVGRLVLAGEIFAEPVEYAVGFFERLKGLLGRSDMNTGSAMIIEHCSSVHTVGMRFAIDLIFLVKEWHVISRKLNVKPGKLMVSGGVHAKRVVESKAGDLPLDHLKSGNELEFHPSDG